MTEPKYLIWSNYSLDYEDWREDLEAEYPELSEQEREEKMYERNSEYLDDERMNLDIQLDKPILVIVDLGLWNGRYSGYKEIKSGNIKDCLFSECDYVTLACKTAPRKDCAKVSLWDLHGKSGSNHDCLMRRNHSVLRRLYIKVITCCIHTASCRKYSMLI